MKEKKLLNTFDIFAHSAGNTIGAGVFVLLGIGITFTGKSICLVMVVGAFLMLVAYLFNLIMSSMFVLKGGDYSQKAMCFGPLGAGIIAYINFVDGFAFSLLGLSIVSYASTVFPNLANYGKIYAVILISLFFATTIVSDKFVARIKGLLVTVLFATLILFVVFGLKNLRGDYLPDSNFFAGGMKGFWIALSLTAYASMGTTVGAIDHQIVTKDPKRTVIKGMIWGTLAVAVIYGLMGVVAGGVLPIEQVMGDSITVVAKAMYNPVMYGAFIICGICFALCGSLLGQISMHKYPIEQVAEEGWLPSIFKKKTEGGYPWVRMTTFYLISIIPILFGFDLDFIVSLLTIPTMLINAWCNFYCIKLVKMYPEHWEKSCIHMTLWLFYVLITVACGTCLMVCYNLFIDESFQQKVIQLVILGILLSLSMFSVKTGRVDVTKIESRRAAAHAEARASLDE